MTTVSEALLDALASAGVHDLFGVVGDAINPLVDAVRRDDRIRWVHVRHEETGVFAASAQAKLTGHLAACAGTVGPGAIHLLNGLYDAAKDHAPVLAITGQVARAEVGSNFHQEVDLQALFADVAVFNETIMTTDQAPRLIAAAIATGRRPPHASRRPGRGRDHAGCPLATGTKTPALVDPTPDCYCPATDTSHARGMSAVHWTLRTNEHGSGRRWTSTSAHASTSSTTPTWSSKMSSSTPTTSG